MSSAPLAQSPERRPPRFHKTTRGSSKFSSPSQLPRASTGQPTFSMHAGPSSHGISPQHLLGHQSLNSSPFFDGSPDSSFHRQAHPSSSQSVQPTHVLPGSFATSNNLMPPPPLPYHSTPGSNSLGAASSPTGSSVSDSISPQNQFGFYPQQNFPHNPYFVDNVPFLQSDPSEYSEWAGEQDESLAGMEAEFDGHMGFDTESLYSHAIPPSEIGTSYSVANSSLSKATGSSRPTKTPRPPNAWILYRSDKLKAIAAGDTIKGLEAVMTELYPSGSSAGTSNESGDAEESNTGSEIKRKKPRKPKAKKGAKEPTEGLLSLGRGKTGRGLPQADISKMISMLWKQESPEVRTQYERMSEMKKQEHQAKYPGYKFQPLRKIDKIRMREEREKEKAALKRERESVKNASRNRGGSRRDRTRNRFSPTASYPAGSDARSSRSMSYMSAFGGLDGGDPSAWADASGQALDYPYSEAPSSRMRSYPFPMPIGSLPSMRVEDHGGNPFGDLSLAYEDPNKPSLTDGQYLHLSQEATPVHSSGSSPAKRPSTAPNMLAPPSAKGRPPMMSRNRHSLGNASHPQHSVPPHARPQYYPQMQMEPLSIIDVQSNLHLQLPPSVVEEYLGSSETPGSSPSKHNMDGSTSESSGPSKGKGKAKPKPRPTTDKKKANRLAAMWCAIEEEDEETMTDSAESHTAPSVPTLRVEDASPNARGGSHQGSVGEERTPTMKSFASIELSSKNLGDPGTGSAQNTMPLNEATSSQPEADTDYYVHSGPWTLLMPDGKQLQQEFSADQISQQHLTVGEWYDMVQDPMQFLVAVPGTEGSAGDNNHGNTQFVLPDLSAGDHATNMGLVPMHAMMEEERGPFLSSQGPIFSPTDAEWTLRPTALNQVQNVASNSDDTSRRPSYSVTKASGEPLPFNVVPRHVSTAGYPTPVSADASGSGWTGNDRSTSFALNAFNGEMTFPPEMDISEELFWQSFEIAPDQPPPTASHLTEHFGTQTIPSSESSPNPLTSDPGQSSYSGGYQSSNPSMSKGCGTGTAGLETVEVSKETSVGMEGDDEMGGTVKARKGGKRARAVARRFPEA